jgi:hypothetical protein
VSAQALAALNEANRIRIVRAEVKRQVAAEKNAAASRRLAALHIDHPTEECARMAVVELLTTCRRLGGIGVAKYLRAAQVPPLTPLGRLTQRQRRSLVAALHAPSSSELRMSRRTGSHE